jgi:hypothetical protein
MRLFFFTMFMDQKQIENGKMATVIGIFEYQFKKKMPLTLLNLALKLEDLHISMILLMLVYYGL